MPSFVTSTMPPTLETIPVEIRQDIYSYILLDQNVAYAVGSCTSLNAYKLKYETAVFRVSKLISTESLQYFYSQNTFIALTLNLRSYSNESLLRKCHTIIPMCGGPETITPKHIALDINVDIAEKLGSSHKCGVLRTGPSEPQYILPNNFKFEERSINSVKFVENRQISRLGTVGQSYGLQRQPGQGAPVTEHANRTMGPQPHQTEGTGVMVELPNVPQHNLLLMKLRAAPRPVEMSTAIFAARHFTHFIYLLNDFVSESHRWRKKQISRKSETRSVLEIKFGSFSDSSRIAELVDGLNGIHGSSLATELSPGENKILTQDPDIMIDVKLLGNVSQEIRERIKATGISTIGTMQEKIDQVLTWSALGDYCYKHGDFIEARKQYSIAKLLVDNLLCRIECEGSEGRSPRVTSRTDLRVQAIEVSVGTALALAKTEGQLGFGADVADILIRYEWSIAGKKKLFPADPIFLADFYWQWGLILQEGGAYPKAFLQFEKAYVASPSSMIEAKINEVGALFTHIKRV